MTTALLVVILLSIKYGMMHIHPENCLLMQTHVWWENSSVGLCYLKCLGMKVGEGFSGIRFEGFPSYFN